MTWPTFRPSLLLFFLLSCAGEVQDVDVQKLKNIESSKIHRTANCGKEYIEVQIYDSNSKLIDYGCIAFVDPAVEENAFHILDDSARIIKVTPDKSLCFRRDSVFNLYHTDSLIAFWSDRSAQLRSFLVVREAMFVEVR